jgi:hypothetical protein
MPSSRANAQHQHAGRRTPAPAPASWPAVEDPGASLGCDSAHLGGAVRQSLPRCLPGGVLNIECMAKVGPRDPLDQGDTLGVLVGRLPGLVAGDPAQRVFRPVQREQALGTRAQEVRVGEPRSAQGMTRKFKPCGDAYEWPRCVTSRHAQADSTRRGPDGGRRVSDVAGSAGRRRADGADLRRSRDSRPGGRHRPRRRHHSGELRQRHASPRGRRTGPAGGSRPAGSPGAPGRGGLARLRLSPDAEPGRGSPATPPSKAPPSSAAR